MKTTKITRFGILACLVLVQGAASAAEITWTADPFDTHLDVSTTGTLVEAVNLGAASAVTVNGVTFAADPGVNTFFVSGNNYVNADNYYGGAIGDLSDADAQTLLDTVEYGPGTGNSRARLDGLTVGQDYMIQLLMVTDRGTSTPTYKFGYSTPSGDATETYTLSDIDCTQNVPYVITGTFTATEAVQDIHVAKQPVSAGDNGEVNAYQLRAIAVPESAPRITSFTSVGTNLWELTLTGDADTGYEFYSSTTLEFNPGTLLEGLTQGDSVNDPGDVGGTNDSVLTTDTNGDGKVRITLAGNPRDFVRAQTAPPPPPIFEENFDSTTGPGLPAGWTTDKNLADNSSLTDWELGTPSVVGPVPPGVPLPSGTNCVATNIDGDYDDPATDLGDPHTDIWLRSPAIDVSGATAGTLSFQQWTQIEQASGDLDYGSIRILDASDDGVLATLENRTIDGSTSGWEEYSMALPAAAFTATSGTIKIEWQFEADDIDSFAGWYIDNVAVSAN